MNTDRTAALAALRKVAEQSGMAPGYLTERLLNGEVPEGDTYHLGPGLPEVVSEAAEPCFTPSFIAAC